MIYAKFDAHLFFGPITKIERSSLNLIFLSEPILRINFVNFKHVNFNAFEDIFQSIILVHYQMKQNLFLINLS